MHGDERYSRFFAYLNLFAASMLVLVLGSSFLMTFMGWEGVGLCSYLLISFWFERNAAAVAGKKAFVTNRVGDFGFMLAMFVIFQKLGTLDYAALGGTAHLSQSTVTAIALLLFVGAMGKSAQVPLHIWLPDAMEGPTPVSALIHAATMVTAGVFLVVRAHVFFDLSNHAGTVVAWVGAITALYAATVALAQNDIKRVLAYSTISQLGYMFLAVGVGAYSAAIFHMVTHAFFKALLVPRRGFGDPRHARRAGHAADGRPAQVHADHRGHVHRRLARDRGHLSVRRFLVEGRDPGQGVVRSRLRALGRGRRRRVDHRLLHDPAGLARLLRPRTLARRRGDRRRRRGRARDRGGACAGARPRARTSRVAVDDVRAARRARALVGLGGLIDLPFTNAKLNLLDRWLELPESHAATSFGAGLALSTVALVVGVVGIAFGISVYRNGLRRDGADPGVERLGGLGGVLANAWYLDIGLARFVSGPVTAFARFLSDGVDRAGIDGAVNGIATAARTGGGGLRRLQSGLVRNYALGIALGAVLLLLYVATRVTF